MNGEHPTAFPLVLNAEACTLAVHLYAAYVKVYGDQGMPPFDTLQPRLQSAFVKLASEMIALTKPSAVSFNGRTAAFGAANAGSSPAAVAKPCPADAALLGAAVLEFKR